MKFFAEGPFGADGGGPGTLTSLFGFSILASLARCFSFALIIARRPTEPSRSNSAKTGHNPTLCCPPLHSRYAFLAASLAEIGGPPRTDRLSLYLMRHIPRKLPFSGSVLLLISDISPKLEKR